MKTLKQVNGMNKKKEFEKYILVKLTKNDKELITVQKYCEEYKTEGPVLYDSYESALVELIKVAYRDKEIDTYKSIKKFIGWIEQHFYPKDKMIAFGKVADKYILKTKHEQQLKDARVDENKNWLTLMKDQGTFSIYRIEIENRITEIEKCK